MVVLLGMTFGWLHRDITLPRAGEFRKKSDSDPSRQCVDLSATDLALNDWLKLRLAV